MKQKIFLWTIIFFCVSFIVYGDVYDYLYAYYPFDNNVNVSNSSIYDVDGVISGNVIPSTMCLIGLNNCSYYFSGSSNQDDYINIGDNFFVPYVTYNYTHSFWININNSPEDSHTMGYFGLQKNIGGASYSITSFMGDTFFRFIEDVTSGMAIIDVTHPDFFIDTNKWYHIVMVLDDNTAYIYVNGTLATSSNWDDYDLDFDGVNTIGVHNTVFGLNDHSLDGWLDEISFWITPFNASMVESLYNCTVKGVSVDDCFKIPGPTPPINYTPINYTNATGVLQLGECPFNQDGSGLYIAIILSVGFISIMVGLVASTTFLVAVGSLFFMFSYLYLAPCSNIMALIFLGTGILTLLYSVFKALD